MQWERIRNIPTVTTSIIELIYLIPNKAPLGVDDKEGEIANAMQRSTRSGKEFIL